MHKNDKVVVMFWKLESIKPYFNVYHVSPCQNWILQIENIKCNISGPYLLYKMRYKSQDLI